MLIKIGFDIAYTAPQPTPMVVMLSVHPSRVADLLAPENIVCDPPTPIHYYHDGFGNWCGRLVIPSGRSVLSNRATVRDSGLLDAEMPNAEQIPVENLPDDVIFFLLPSRYCEIDRMMDLAWSLFKDAPTGWGRVQAICDYVHNHVTFGYQFAAATKSAHDVHAERRGVCRDFAHLAVTLCRCMNIPARYCTGYLGDIGVPPDDRRWISAPGSRSTCPAAGSPFDAAPQHAAHRPHPDGARPRRRRRAALDQLRAHDPQRLQGLYRRGRRSLRAMTAPISFATVRLNRPAGKAGYRSGRTLVRLAFLFAAFLALLAGPARADDYPNRPIRVITTTSAGGLSDIFMRALGEELRQSRGQPLIIENRPGGSMNLGTRACAEAAPDGYTICITNADAMLYNQFLFKKLPFDPERSLSRSPSCST